MPNAVLDETTTETTTATTDVAAGNTGTTAATAPVGAAAATTTEAAAVVAAVAPVGTVVPDTYDLKWPDGSTLDPAIVERTAATARALGLTNEAGQKLLDQTVQDLTERQTADEASRAAFVESWKPGGTAYVERDKQWRAEALADPDLGAGDPARFAVSVEKAQQALTKYGPELKTYLEETGLGSHPAAVKFLANIGRAMSEGALVTGSGNVPKPKSDAQLLYPSNYNDDGTPKQL